MRVELPYGSAPYGFDVADERVLVLRAASLGHPAPLQGLLEGAIEQSIGRSLTVSPGARVTVIVSDETRDEPRAAFLNVLRARLPSVRLTLAVATGTHGPSTTIDRLGLPADWLRDASIVNHDGHRTDNLVDLGTTTRGTPIRAHRCVVDTDLVIATGCIRPHYFAGFGAGAKALFPGLGEAAAIRINHRMKTDPAARAGIVVGNPCREDLEEAVRGMAPAFLLNGVCGPDDRVHAAVAGDVVAAFREGVRRATPWFAVRAKPAPLVIASDSLPVSASLYQAAKIAASAAPLVAEGGTLAVVAECRDGIEPIETVNEAIFRIGVLPRLPSSARLVLISTRSRAETEQTLLAYAPSVDHLLQETEGRVLVVPNASHVIAEAAS
jgi:lactate racemase